MVKIMENPMNKWMIWGYSYFRKHPYAPTKGKSLGEETLRTEHAAAGSSLEKMEEASPGCGRLHARMVNAKDIVIQNYI